MALISIFLLYLCPSFIIFYLCLYFWHVIARDTGCQLNTFSQTCNSCSFKIFCNGIFKILFIILYDSIPSSKRFYLLLFLFIIFFIHFEKFRRFNYWLSNWFNYYISKFLFSFPRFVFLFFVRSTSRSFDVLIIEVLQRILAIYRRRVRRGDD